ncbi:hypothetical protein [Brachybacterium sp. ACRRE]|uniref:hypothetical protein n=1 Tax=Brachybacterium sp. ACRRE TaxID=2918184 RepID=UPI001EF32814|nr:hypothetical protein [Brachybacterium sp. ACRRE]MCG7310197.1 hypothetical protein [Brachybacterium sp. ACRRE]
MTPGPAQIPVRPSRASATSNRRPGSGPDPSVGWDPSVGRGSDRDPGRRGGRPLLGRRTLLAGALATTAAASAGLLTGCDLLEKEEPRRKVALEMSEVDVSPGLVTSSPVRTGFWGEGAVGDLPGIGLMSTLSSTGEASIRTFVGGRVGATLDIEPSTSNRASETFEGRVRVLTQHVVDGAYVSELWTSADGDAWDSRGLGGSIPAVVEALRDGVAVLQVRAGTVRVLTIDGEATVTERTAIALPGSGDWTVSDVARTGDTILVLLDSGVSSAPGHAVVSTDGGATWGEPQEIPASRGAVSSGADACIAQGKEIVIVGVRDADPKSVKGTYEYSYPAAWVRGADGKITEEKVPLPTFALEGFEETSTGKAIDPDSPLEDIDAWVSGLRGGADGPVLMSVGWANRFAAASRSTAGKWSTQTQTYGATDLLDFAMLSNGREDQTLIVTTTAVWGAQGLMDVDFDAGALAVTDPTLGVSDMLPGPDGLLLMTKDTTWLSKDSKESEDGNALLWSGWASAPTSVPFHVADGLIAKGGAGTEKALEHVDVPVMAMAVDPDGGVILSGIEVSEGDVKVKGSLLFARPAGDDAWRTPTGLPDDGDFEPASLTGIGDAQYLCGVHRAAFRYDDDTPRSAQVWASDDGIAWEQRGAASDDDRIVGVAQVDDEVIGIGTRAESTGSTGTTDAPSGGEQSAPEDAAGDDGGADEGSSSRAAIFRLEGDIWKPTPFGGGTSSSVDWVDRTGSNVLIHGEVDGNEVIWTLGEDGTPVETSRFDDTSARYAGLDLGGGAMLATGWVNDPGRMVSGVVWASADGGAHWDATPIPAFEGRFPSKTLVPDGDDVVVVAADDWGLAGYAIKDAAKQILPAE